VLLVLSVHRPCGWNWFWFKNCKTSVIFLFLCPRLINIQLNPDFSNPRFFKPWHISLGFASVKHCNFAPDFSNPRFFETPDFSNQFLPPLKEIYKKFTFDFSNLHKILKLLLSSFHLNGHMSQTQKVQPPSITQWTVPRKVLLSAFHLNGHSLGLAFLWVLFIMCIWWF